MAGGARRFAFGRYGGAGRWLHQPPGPCLPSLAGRCARQCGGEPRAETRQSRSRRSTARRSGDHHGWPPPIRSATVPTPSRRRDCTWRRHQPPYRSWSSSFVPIPDQPVFLRRDRCSGRIGAAIRRPDSRRRLCRRAISRVSGRLPDCRFASRRRPGPRPRWSAVFSSGTAGRLEQVEVARQGHRQDHALGAAVSEFARLEQRKIPVEFVVTRSA